MMDEFYNNFHEFNEATKTELVNFIKSKTTAWISMSNSFELVSSCTKELLLEPDDDETKEDPNEALKNMIKMQLKNSMKVATTSMLSKRFMKFLENDADKAYTNLLSSNGSFQHIGSDNQKYDQPLSELLEKAFGTLPNGKYVVIAVNDDPRAKDNRFMTTKRLQFVK
jgi:hypothetical protein